MYDEQQEERQGGENSDLELESMGNRGWRRRQCLNTTALALSLGRRLSRFVPGIFDVNFHGAQ